MYKGIQVYELQSNYGGMNFMGMSASQTRYVFLSGRKTDVEFDGQQINQQRTTLATESSALNTGLLNLKVPTPPSLSDYTKTTYTADINGKSVTITGTQYQANAYTLGGTQYPGGTYIVNASEEATAPQGKSSGSSLFSSTTTGNPPVTTYLTSQGTPLTPVVNDPNDPTSVIDVANCALIAQDCNLPNGTTFFKYTTTGGQVKYVTEQDLQRSASTAQNPSTTAIPSYIVDENATVTQVARIPGCVVNWNESGRMTSITDSTGASYSLTVKTTSNNEAFTDAMNEYEYQKGIYDKQMNDINAKMCIIQSEDKKLELKLKDLDTQQEAINTELDSVKKVVDKDIEQSFKAFA